MSSIWIGFPRCLPDMCGRDALASERGSIGCGPHCRTRRVHLLRWIYDECRLDTEWMTSMDPAIDDRTTPTYPVRLPVWWGMERPHSEDEPIPDSTVRLWHRKRRKALNDVLLDGWALRS